MRNLSILTLILLLSVNTLAADLASWNKSASRKAIIEFVETVTNKKSKHYVEPSQRIAVFDNDGTLWAEQPAYFQLYFAIDRIKAMAKDHPEWNTTEPFKSVLAGDLKTALSSEKHLIELVMTSHTGMTQQAFREEVLAWINTAKHPTTAKKFTEMVYQPMLEVLNYLRKNGFKTYIVSGGGIDFMRPWVEAVYGIPPEQVIGSQIKKRFDIIDDKSVIIRLPELSFNNDKTGKPLGIDTHIGQRPIAAFGNSDGDLAMLQYATSGSEKSLAVYIHHTDEKREWAYDKDSHIGRLDKGLIEAKKQGWSVVDMRKDWRAIYP